MRPPQSIFWPAALLVAIVFLTPPATPPAQATNPTVMTAPDQAPPVMVSIILSTPQNWVLATFVLLAGLCFMRMLTPVAGQRGLRMLKLPQSSGVFLQQATVPTAPSPLLWVMATAQDEDGELLEAYRQLFRLAKAEGQAGQKKQALLEQWEGQPAILEKILQAYSEVCDQDGKKN